MHEMAFAVLSKFQEIIRGYASSKSFSFGIPPPEMPKLNRNIAKGTTDPRVEFILPKQLLEVISEVQT